jgi:hypothetical protein
MLDDLADEQLHIHDEVDDELELLEVMQVEQYEVMVEHELIIQQYSEPLYEYLDGLQDDEEVEHIQQGIEVQLHQVEVLDIDEPLEQEPQVQLTLVDEDEVQQLEQIIELEALE